MKTKELYMRYGVMLRKRKRWKQKLNFLSILKNEFEQMGYQAKIMEKKYKSKKSLSLYVNNIENKKIIFATSYDNPIISPIKRRPFNDKNRKMRNLIGGLIPFSLILVFSLILIKWFNIQFWSINPYSLKSLISYLVLIVNLIILSRYKQGIPKNEMLFNTSSIVETIKFAKDNPEYGYVFTDYGEEDLFGYLCLRDYLVNQNYKLVFIDTIGNNSNDILVLKTKDIKNNNILSEWFDDPLFVTSGKIVENDIFQKPDKVYENDNMMLKHLKIK